MAATEFQIDIEKVKVTRADTAITPYDNFGASSRTTYTTGNAVIIACQDAIDQLKEAAGRKVGLAKKQVTIKNGKLILSDQILSLLILLICMNRLVSSLNRPGVF